MRRVPTTTAPLVTLLCGVLAASHLGAVAPVSNLISRDLQLSPGMTGAAISVITLMAALAATPVGAWSAGRQPAWLVCCGGAALATTAAATALFAYSGPAFLLLRVVAGIGYLLVVVAGPPLLLAQAEPGSAPIWLALWGSCIPAGLALSSGAGGIIGSRLGWRGWLLVLAVVTALGAGLVALQPRDRPTGPTGNLRRPADRRFEARRPLLLALAFSLVALIPVTVASLWPSFLTDARQLQSGRAGVLTSLVAIASVPGSLIAAVLLRRGISRRLLGSGALLCPLLAVPGFATDPPLAATVLAAATSVLLAGIAVAAAYASLTVVVSHPGQLPLANGLLVQLGSAGTLLAPPAAAAATGLHHWRLLPGLLAGPAAFSLLLLVAATSGTGRRPVPDRSNSPGPPTHDLPSPTTHGNTPEESPWSRST